MLQYQLYQLRLFIIKQWMDHMEKKVGYSQKKLRIKEIYCGSLLSFLVPWAEASTLVQMGSFQDHIWHVAEIPLQFPAEGEFSS